MGSSTIDQGKRELKLLIRGLAHKFAKNKSSRHRRGGEGRRG